MMPHCIIPLNPMTLIDHDATLYYPPEPHDSNRPAAHMMSHCIIPLNPMTLIDQLPT